jgi:hypothetical protein
MKKTHYYCSIFLSLAVLGTVSPPIQSANMPRGLLMTTMCLLFSAIVNENNALRDNSIAIHKDDGHIDNPFNDLIIDGTTGTTQNPFIDASDIALQSSEEIDICTQGDQISPIYEENQLYHNFFFSIKPGGPYECCFVYEDRNHSSKKEDIGIKVTVKANVEITTENGHGAYCLAVWPYYTALGASRRCTIKVSDVPDLHFKEMRCIGG